MQNEWISVKDKFPPINTLIFVYEDDQVRLSAINDLEHFKLHECPITHWLPFPEPPK